RPRNSLLLVDPELRRRWRSNEDDVAAASTDPPHRLGAARDDPIGKPGRDVRSLEPVPGVTRVALEVASRLDAVPHEILPSRGNPRSLPSALYGAVALPAPAVIDSRQPLAEPIVVVHESEVVLQPAIDPKSGQL